MTKQLFAFIFIAVAIISCSENNQSKETKVVEEPKKEAMAVKADTLYKNVAFDNPKDLSCGMPVTAGVSDTAHYKNKVYGFCSKECKEDFMKSPEEHLAAK